MSKSALLAFVLALLISEGNFWLFGRRRRRSPPSCTVQSCDVSEWSAWSSCSQNCGNNGEQTRERFKTREERCGGSCYYEFYETQACNRFCYNEGTPQDGYCNCRSGFSGKCCEIDNRVPSSGGGARVRVGVRLKVKGKVGIGLGVFFFIVILVVAAVCGCGCEC